MPVRRAAIYARYSSERQNERSCADQVALCEAFALRQGLTVTASYDDAAISGASTVNRPGLGRLLHDARSRRFDVVLCEALDRLSRDQADLARLKKELAFLDVAIVTVQDGEVGAMHIGLKGLMGELYLADLAQKTRRGQAARVREGAIGGGSTYGYRSAGAGTLSVEPFEAAIVNRIFAEYVDGSTPRQIVARLNAEHVPGPRGGGWNASTLNGSRSRRNGVLHNRLYIGEIVWNRQRFIKDPATGRRVSRPNPQTDWVTSTAPELAIVPAEIFEAAARRSEERALAGPAKTRRPRHLLSGLIKCGCCGASYTVVGRDRLGCAGYRERGDCANARTITRREVEDRVVAALQRHLGEPELIEVFVEAYRDGRRRRAAEARRDRRQIERRLGEVNRAIGVIVDRILYGTTSPSLEAPLPGLEEEKLRLTDQLAAADQEMEEVSLHPAAARAWAAKVADLRTCLALPDGRSEAIVEQVRSMLTTITVTPHGPREPVDITVSGLLASLLAISDGSLDPCRVTVVAGAGFEPATFRL